jgi:hypothetical protein
MIRELTQYVKNGTSFILDTNLFAGFRPADAPDRCVAILEPTGGAVNSYFPDAGEKVVQVLTRATSYWDARSDAYVVFDLLKSKAQVTFPTLVSDTTYKAEFIEAQHFPQSLQQDEEGRWEFSINFVIRIRKM